MANVVHRLLLAQLLLEVFKLGLLRLVTLPGRQIISLNASSTGLDLLDLSPNLYVTFNHLNSSLLSIPTFYSIITKVECTTPLNFMDILYRALYSSLGTHSLTVERENN